MQTQTTSPVSTPDPDPAAIEAFSGEMVNVFNHSLLGLMISIGHRTGLFDVMAGLPASTSATIAREAGLHERYVREWLSSMTTGGVVDYDPDPGTYHLPPERAASLVRSSGADNLAMLFQYVPLLGNVEEQIVDCFHNGGGVPYSAYGRFQELQAEESARVFDDTLVGRTLPLDPAVLERLHEGIDACDVGCGQGHAICVMAREFPKSRFVGYDISEEGVAAAQREAKQLGLDNARFEVLDVATFEGGPRFDFVTAFDCIHDMAHPARVLRGIRSLIRDGGTFLMVDIHADSELHNNRAHPLATALYTFSCLHCMTVSLAQGGDGLGAMWGEQKARQLLGDAGFEGLVAHQVPGDIMNTYYFARRV